MGQTPPPPLKKGREREVKDGEMRKQIDKNKWVERELRKVKPAKVILIFQIREHFFTVKKITLELGESRRSKLFMIKKVMKNSLESLKFIGIEISGNM